MGFTSKQEMTFEEWMEDYLTATKYCIERIKLDDIFAVADMIAYTQYERGRLFIIGVGGSAGNASHAVNDFRKLCGIQAYAPTDNVSELTARVNDSCDGWDTYFVEWLKTSNLQMEDTLLILSVGGGDECSRVSKNIVNAIKYAKLWRVGVVGIVGKKGYTFEHADACVLIPEVSPDMTTPITESMQSVIWHLIANSPGLKKEDKK